MTLTPRPDEVEVVVVWAVTKTARVASKPSPCKTNMAAVLFLTLERCGPGSSARTQKEEENKGWHPTAPSNRNPGALPCRSHDRELLVVPTGGRVAVGCEMCKPGWGSAARRDTSLLVSYSSLVWCGRDSAMATSSRQERFTGSFWGTTHISMVRPEAASSAEQPPGGTKPPCAESSPTKHEFRKVSKRDKECEGGRFILSWRHEAAMDAPLALKLCSFLDTVAEAAKSGGNPIPSRGTGPLSTPSGTDCRELVSLPIPMGPSRGTTRRCAVWCIFRPSLRAATCQQSRRAQTSSPPDRALLDAILKAVLLKLTFIVQAPLPLLVQRAECAKTRRSMQPIVPSAPCSSLVARALTTHHVDRSLF